MGTRRPHWGKPWARRGMSGLEHVWTRASTGSTGECQHWGRPWVHMGANTALGARGVPALPWAHEGMPVTRGHASSGVALRAQGRAHTGTRLPAPGQTLGVHRGTPTLGHGEGKGCYQVPTSFLFLKAGEGSPQGQGLRQQRRPLGAQEGSRASYAWANDGVQWGGGPGRARVCERPKVGGQPAPGEALGVQGRTSPPAWAHGYSPAQGRALGAWGRASTGAIPGSKGACPGGGCGSARSSRCQGKPCVYLDLPATGQAMGARGRTNTVSSGGRT